MSALQTFATTRRLEAHLRRRVQGKLDIGVMGDYPLLVNLARFLKVDPEQALRRIASIKAADATPFARFLPDLAVTLIRGKDGRARIYSLVRNREHANVSWILGESERFAPQEDSLTVRAGVLGAYPNMFFVVPEAEIDVFSSAIARLNSAADYERLVDSFGVRRSNERFWSVYDAINLTHLASDPVRSGILDLTRYAIEEK
jgi:hypothetical protein